VLARKNKECQRKQSTPKISEIERKRREAVWELFKSECVFLIDHLMALKHVSSLLLFLYSTTMYTVVHILWYKSMKQNAQINSSDNRHRHQLVAICNCENQFECLFWIYFSFLVPSASLFTLSSHNLVFQFVPTVSQSLFYFSCLPLPFSCSPYLFSLILASLFLPNSLSYPPSTHCNCNCNINCYLNHLLRIFFFL